MAGRAAPVPLDACDTLDTYKDRQLETKELTFNARKKAGVAPKVCPDKDAEVSSRKGDGLLEQESGLAELRGRI